MSAPGMSAIPPSAPAVPPPPASPVDTMLPPPTVAVKPTNLGAAFVEAAAFLLVWSMCVTIEGALRFNSVNPSSDLSVTAAGTANRIALFIGGLAEVFFGLMGLYLAVYALLFRRYSPSVTRAALVIQAVLGTYVFLTFVVVEPSYTADNIPVTGVQLTDGVILSRGITRWLITLGIFTSAHFCLALQGGQFLFMARLIAAAEGDDFLKMRSGSHFRAIFWNANFSMAGFWTFVFACTYASKTVDKTPFAFPPHVGNNAGFAIFVGLLMFLWGALGVMLSLSPTSDLRWYYAGCALVFLFTYLNFTIVQLGLLEDAGAQAIGMHTGLVFFVSLLGPYFLHQSTKKGEE